MIMRTLTTGIYNATSYLERLVLIKEMTLFKVVFHDRARGMDQLNPKGEQVFELLKNRIFALNLQFMMNLRDGVVTQVVLKQTKPWPIHVR